MADNAQHDGRAARWEGQRAKRRTEIINAALGAIDEHGPGVSTEQIAQHAGVARPALYRHFNGADDLYDSVARAAGEQIVGQLLPVFTSPAGTARELIDRAVRAYVEWLSGHLHQYRYVLLRTVDTRSGLAPLIADVRTAIGCPLRDLLGAYLVVFGQDPAIADPLAFGVIGMVESATNRWLALPGQLSKDELITQVSDWTWGMVEAMLRTLAVDLDQHGLLPRLSDDEQPG